MLLAGRDYFVSVIKTLSSWVISLEYSIKAYILRVGVLVSKALGC